MVSPPEGKTFLTYSKMRAQAHGNGHQYYRCRSREMGHECDQKSIHADRLDTQVLSILSQIEPPADWQTYLTKRVGEIIGEKYLDIRLEEFKSTIQLMDKRCANVLFLDDQEYFEERLKLQSELEQLQPICCGTSIRTWSRWQQMLRCSMRL